MRRALPIVALLLVLCGASAARAEAVVAGLSDTIVNIRSNFVGVELTLFGVIQRDAATVGRAHGYTVVVVVEGPREDIVTRRKQRVAGLWMNRESVTFRRVPSYYAVLASDRIDDLSHPTTIGRLQIGLDNLDLQTEGKNLPPDVEVFRHALLRRKEESRLYLENGDAVEMLEPSIFMTRIPLPANILTGGYRAHVYVFSDGALVATKRLGFWVVRGGFEAAVFDLAEDDPVVYGVVAVLLAVFAGWIAGIVFRRD